MQQRPARQLSNRLSIGSSSWIVVKNSSRDVAANSSREVAVAVTGLIRTRSRSRTLRRKSNAPNTGARTKLSRHQRRYPPQTRASIWFRTSISRSRTFRSKSNACIVDSDCVSPITHSSRTSCSSIHRHIKSRSTHRSITPS